MKRVVEADKITGKVTVEYTGKGPRNQEVEQGRLALPIVNRALELLTLDNPWRVEVVKATCTGTYEAFLGHPFSEKSKCGNFIDFLVVLGAVVEGKLKVTIRWEGWEEAKSELCLIRAEHSFGCPSVGIRIPVKVGSFEERTEGVAKGLIKAVAKAIAQLKSPLARKEKEVSEAEQEINFLIETLEKEEAVA